MPHPMIHDALCKSRADPREGHEFRCGGPIDIDHLTRSLASRHAARAPGRNGTIHQTLSRTGAVAPRNRQMFREICKSCRTDPGDPGELFRPAERPVPLPVLDDPPGQPRTDPGKPVQFHRIRPVGIDPLPGGEGSGGPLLRHCQDGAGIPEGRRRLQPTGGWRRRTRGYPKADEPRQEEGSGGPEHDPSLDLGHDPGWGTGRGRGMAGWDSRAERPGGPCSARSPTGSQPGWAPVFPRDQPPARRARFPAEKFIWAKTPNWNWVEPSR